MTHLSRRTLLTGALATSLALTLPTAAAASSVTGRLREIEQNYGGRIGVTAFRTGQVVNHRPVVSYRSGERFALCSTFKMLAVAAVLRRARRCEPGLMERLIRYRREDLVANSPITEQHVEDGMSVTALCDAAMRYSDNTAANLLLNQLGGPSGITRFARSLGDPHTRLDRYETELNSNVPGDPRDTTTPASMAANLDKLCLGRALASPDRATLVDWMVRNTTGDQRIRARGCRRAGGSATGPAPATTGRPTTSRWRGRRTPRPWSSRCTPPGPSRICPRTTRSSRS